MERYQELIGQQIHAVLVLLFAVAFSLSIPKELKAQTKKGLQIKMAGADTSQVSADAEEGMPERGQFQFVYSYSGEPISPEITITLNGSPIAELGGLSPTSIDTLVNRTVAKGDKINLLSSFGITDLTMYLHSGLFGYPQGLWAGEGSITFYEFDPSDGTIIKEYGTMDFVCYHYPPWNGIAVETDPAELAPGGSSAISLQPYESPAQEVIIPGQTYINLQPVYWEI